MTSAIPIRVVIPHEKFWTIARQHPVHMNVSVFKTLRDAGIPVDGGLDLRGVTHGRLTAWNERGPTGERLCIYEWLDTGDKPILDPSDEDDEL